MSFFPHPDPAKLRAAMAQNYTIYQTPPTPSTSRRGRDMPHATTTMSPWPMSCTASAGSQYPSAHVTAWPSSSEARGLGLLSLPVTTDGFYAQSSTVTASTMAETMAWTAHAESSANAGMARKDSGVEHCHPLSTLLPASAMWTSVPSNGSQTMIPIHEMSPGRSDYSNASSRPSVGSSPYTHSESVYPSAHSPSVKIEDAIDHAASGYHYVANSTSLDRSMLVNPCDLVGGVSVPCTMDDGGLAAFLPATTKVEYSTDEQVTEHDHQRPRASSHLSQATSVDSSFDELRQQKRGFTTAANSTCACEQCGKLFQRSYNLKAHMETHDPHRDQPHACQYAGCRRKFVRRTDLLRHEQSVHLKVRNYPCPLCDASFARKDTLRRHVDDGCPKRPEVKKRVPKQVAGRHRSLSRASMSSGRRPSSVSASSYTPQQAFTTLDPYAGGAGVAQFY